MEVELIFIKNQDDIYEKQPKISYVKIYWVMMMHQYIYKLHNPLQLENGKVIWVPLHHFFFFWW